MCQGQCRYRPQRGELGRRGMRILSQDRGVPASDLGVDGMPVSFWPRPAKTLLSPPSGKHRSARSGGTRVVEHSVGE